jgi:hypothetical protein
VIIAVDGCLFLKDQFFLLFTSTSVVDVVFELGNAVVLLAVVVVAALTRHFNLFATTLLVQFEVSVHICQCRYVHQQIHLLTVICLYALPYYDHQPIIRSQ